MRNVSPKPWQIQRLDWQTVKATWQHITTARLTKHVIRFAAVLVAVYIVVVGLGAFVIYRQASPNSFTGFVERLFPYPAARVGDDFIYVQRYRLDTNALNFYADIHEFDSQPGETEQFVINQLIDRTLYAQALRDANITVDDTAVKTRLDEIYEQIGDEAKLAEYLRQNYGNAVTVSIFKNWLREAALELAVQQQLLERVRLRHILVAAPEGSSEEQVEAARQKAAEIRGGITDNNQFAEVARNQSDDVASRDKGGEFGITNRGDTEPILSADFENAIFSLEPGQISDPVRTPYGWHIVLVEEKFGSVPLSKREYTEQLRREKGVKVYIPLPETAS